MNKRIKKAAMTALTAQFVMSMTMVSFASSYAENGVKWFLDQAFWVVIGVMVFCAIAAYVKHATAAMVTSIIVGGIVAFMCKNPESVIKIGEALGKAVTGG